MNIIKQLLDQKGVTPYRMAVDLGLPQSTVSEWINNEYKPKADKLMLIAKYLGVSVETLIEGLKNEQGGNS